MCAVEWKKLGDVCEVGTGSNNREDACDKGLYPFYVRSKDVLRINKYLFDEEAIIIPGEGGIGDIFHYANGKYGLHQRAYRVHPINKELICKFLYYYLSDKFKQYITSKSVGATATSIRKPMLEGFVLPIPSLAKQQEIVSQLDTFTTLISNLESELDMRRKQYEHYRNQLLDFEGMEGVEWKKIGSITRVFSASRVHKNEWTNEGVPFWRSSDLISFFNNVENPKGKAFISYELYEKLSAKSGKISKNDILVTGGGTIGIPYIVPDDNPLYVKDADLLCIVHNDAFVSKYLFQYMLCSDFRNYLSSLSNNATIAHYTITQINDTIIPLPSKQTQQEIVEKLDAFEQLIQSLEQEIKLRKQQYEYYREKLLTFEKE